jgi:phospholipase/carboxylesterase
MTKPDLSLTHVVHAPSRPVDGKAPLLLMLHGYGSNENDLIAIASYLDDRLFAVSPRAPIPLSFGGYAWFNLQWTADGPTMKPEEEMVARQTLLGFLDEVLAAYPVDPARVYLGGFSQGAILSLSVALTEPQRVAGVVALSGRVLPNVADAAAHGDGALSGLPIIVTHGVYDTVLPIHHAHYTRDRLEALPVDLTYREYPMAHEVSPESLADVAGWVTARVDAGPR